MSYELLELAAANLADLVDEVVFLGGAAIVLWITDPGAPEPRPTLDVDVIVQVATRSEYYAFERRLRAARFQHDQSLICRWVHSESGLVLDAMPQDPSILGFENRWQQAALPWAVERRLPSGAEIRAIPPAFLLATKLGAFASRGGGDMLASRDFADVVSLIDGRKELIDEITGAPAELRTYLVQQFTRLLENPDVLEGISAQLPSDAASQARAQTFVMARLREITVTP